MTDRFYPLGQQSHSGAWKTSYEVANDMQSPERSPFPPGTSVHLPGVIHKFGYSTPGPDASRLARPDLALTEEIGLSKPRAHHAIPRTAVDNDHDTFNKYDMQEMIARSSNPVAAMSLSPGSRSPGSRSGIARTRSLPALKKQPPPRMSEPHSTITRLEDEHYSYFVPKTLQREGKDKLSSTVLSRLHKESRISFPFSGEGTGFKAQQSGCDWWPSGSYSSDMPTSYRLDFQRRSAALRQHL